MFFCYVKFRSLRIHCSDVLVFYSQWSLRSSPFQCENSYRCVPVALNFLPTIHSAVLLISSDWKEKLRKKFGFVCPEYIIFNCVLQCAQWKDILRYNSDTMEHKKTKLRNFPFEFLISFFVLVLSCCRIHPNAGIQMEIVAIVTQHPIQCNDTFYFVHWFPFHSPRPLFDSVRA